VRWDEAIGQYRCGAIVAAREVLEQALPKGAHWLAPVLAPLLRRMAFRWIAVGSGCDSHLEVVRNAGSTTIRTSETNAATRTDSLHHD